MTTNNTIPQTLTGLIALAQIAYPGARTVGPSIDLTHFDAPTLLTRLNAVVGAPPATPGGAATPGTLARFDEAVNAVITANAAHRTTLMAARLYCREVIDYLRRHLGRRWNPDWYAAGFINASLAVPAHPGVMLVRIRSYLAAHPERGNSAIGISDAGVQQQLDAIENACLEAKAKVAERVLVKETRDQSIEALRECLVGLRAELEQLLDADDQRWTQFGFVRPSEGRMPSKVKTLIVRQGLPGEVVANWSRAELASGYRLSWRVNLPGSTPVEVGLLTDRAAIITGLPSGQTVVISLTARNSTGESAATESTIVVL